MILFVMILAAGLVAVSSSGSANLKLCTHTPGWATSVYWWCVGTSGVYLLGSLPAPSSLPLPEPACAALSTYALPHSSFSLFLSLLQTVMAEKGTSQVLEREGWRLELRTWPPDRKPNFLVLSY